MTRHFTHDLETDKLHIRTGGKADWLAMLEADRDTIKRNCLWSKSRDCWVSKAKADRARMWLGDVLARLGFEDRGQEGERLTFAEQVEAKQERAEVRAERAEDRADAAGEEWERRHRASDAITEHIPFGQPILVGHHSEKRHRRDLERSNAHLDKAVAAAEKRKHYEGRAEAARRTAEGKQYSDPGFLGRRIREQEAEERDLLRRLEGKGLINGAATISDDYRERLTRFLEDCRDKLGFYRHCLETCGRTVYDRETLAGKACVLIRGTWERVAKLNRTTVAVYNTAFPAEDSQKKYALKYLYAEVRDAK
jgi:hypothetical protein